MLWSFLWLLREWVSVLSRSFELLLLERCQEFLVKRQKHVIYICQKELFSIKRLWKFSSSLSEDVLCHLLSYKWMDSPAYVIAMLLCWMASDHTQTMALFMLPHYAQLCLPLAVKFLEAHSNKDLSGNMLRRNVSFFSRCGSKGKNFLMRSWDIFWNICCWMKVLVYLFVKCQWYSWPAIIAGKPGLSKGCHRKCYMWEWVGDLDN